MLHAAGDPGIPFVEIAGALGGQLGIPTTSIPADEADGHFGFLGAFVQLDNPTSTELTRQRTGWQPAHPGLIADLEEGHCFAAGSYSKD